ncbi:MAG: F0F1 ATP synthase subunit A [Hyphomicrobiales bacterium]
MYIVVAAIAVVGWLAVGLLIAKGPQPEIIVPAEVITKVGPINISNTMITAWMVMLTLIILSLFITRGMKLLPGSMQNFGEAVVGYLLDQCEEIAGEAAGRKMFAVVATIFLFIIVGNWFGLIPFFNAIGKTEDVGHEIFHEIEEHQADGHLMGCDKHIDDPAAEGALANCDDLKFAAWKMDKGSGIVYAKPQAKNTEFEIPAGQEPAVALDRYAVFLASEFTDLDVSDEELEHPAEDLVRQAYAALEATPDAPKFVAEGAAQGEEGGEGEEAVASPVLGQAFAGVSFEESQKLALVVPFFRSTFSDVNNTLAMGIVAFVFIEIWGFQAIGAGYLKKFFNLNGVNSFVGILELLSEFIRIISFAFRLFGNIFAGEVLILMLTFLMPFLFVDIIYGLELFVGFIQAAVFALLTLVFGAMAMEHHGDDGHEGHDEHGGADAHHETPGAVQAH